MNKQRISDSLYWTWDGSARRRWGNGWWLIMRWDDGYIRSFSCLKWAFAMWKAPLKTPNPVIFTLNLQMIGSRQFSILLIATSNITDDRGNDYQLITRGVKLHFNVRKHDSNQWTPFRYTIFVRRNHVRQQECSFQRFRQEARVASNQINDSSYEHYPYEEASSQVWFYPNNWYDSQPSPNYPAWPAPFS